MAIASHLALSAANTKVLPLEASIAAYMVMAENFFTPVQGIAIAVLLAAVAASALQASSSSALAASVATSELEAGLAAAGLAPAGAPSDLN